MKAKVVIGSGYGDEGKGVFTNQLSLENDKSMVIRFNGGAQAGHTVISPDGKRHVFGHFMANSFIPNSRGYFSKHFIEVVGSFLIALRITSLIFSETSLTSLFEKNL